MGEFSISQLQNYISAKKAEYIELTSPGFQIFFYSRFNLTSDIITKIASDTNQVNTDPIPYMGMSSMLPNAYLSSNVNRLTDVSSVLSIQVRNCINDTGGSTCNLTLVNPENINYFLPTIGSYGKNKTAETGPSNGSSTDYDYSERKSFDFQRIGVMDTVLIRLKTARITPSTDLTADVETVFRGCIKTINRSSSATEGNILTIRLGDFSEYMRMITALPLGMFSTISISDTGRGFVENLVKYTNRLYTGDWRFLGSNLPQQVMTGMVQTIFGAPTFGVTEAGGAITIPDSSGTTTNTPAQQSAAFVVGDQTPGTTAATLYGQNVGTQNNVAASTASATPIGTATNHAMAIPPFIFLEGSSLDKDIIAGNTTAGQLAGATASNDTTGNNAMPSADDWGNIIGKILTNGKNAIAGLGNLLAAPTLEDVETIAYYNAALTPASTPTDLNQYSSKANQVTGAIAGLQQYTWMLADLYFDAGAMSFEHEKVWSTAYTVANRAFREIYFDFAPKLSPNATKPYATASVPEIKSAIKQQQTLHDIHPNIGILKYRLSPCLRAYQEGNDSSHLWQWSITDDEIIKYDLQESSEALYTCVFGFGSAIDKTAVATDVMQAGMGQTQGLLAFAHSADDQIERRVGYRFMTEEDMNIKTPLLMYFTSYILLIQSEMNMFTAGITLVGNPKFKPGSIIRLTGRNIDYYCAEVIHNWSLSDGYTTLLVLKFGHTSGIAPAALTGGSLNDNITENAVCANRSTMLEAYAPKAKTIGGVNLQCMIYALWKFMTCCASTPELLKAAMPESQKAPIKPPVPTGGVLFTNRSWAAQVITNLGCPLTSNNVDNMTRWMTAEELPQNWAGTNDPLNCNLATISQFTYPDLTTAATYTAKNLMGGSYGYPAIVSALQSDADINTFSTAVVQSNWESTHYQGKGPLYLATIAVPPEYTAPATDGKNTGSSALTPGVCTKPVAGLQQWPYPIYGPLGIRLDAYKAYNANVSDDDAKKNLTADFGKAMTASVSYITSLLNKYTDATKPLLHAGEVGTPGVNVDAKDTFSKVIAAWYSNENLMSLNSDDSTRLPTITTSLKTIYGACLICTGNFSTPQTKIDITKNEALNAIDWRIPVDNPIVTSGFKYRSGGASDFHFGVDWQNTAGIGTQWPVYAPASGTVIYLEPQSDAGGGLGIAHNAQQTIASYFWDLHIANGISIGTQVTKGQQIAIMGSAAENGGVGIHCHHEIHIGAGVTSITGSQAPRLAADDPKLTAINPLTNVFVQGKFSYTINPGALTPS